MEFTLADFFIGFFLMNAMPHLLFGLLKIRFFTAFGFSSKGNMAYALINVVLALLLFHIQYGIQTLMKNGFVLGSGTILIIYLLTGRFFFKLFQQNSEALL